MFVIYKSQIIMSTKFVVSITNFEYEQSTTWPIFVFETEQAAKDYAERANKIVDNITEIYGHAYNDFKSKNWPNTPFTGDILVLYKRFAKYSDYSFTVCDVKERAPIKRYSFSQNTKTKWQYVEPVTVVFDTVKDTLNEIMKGAKPC